jgi:hypothetical protein
LIRTTSAPAAAILERNFTRYSELISYLLVAKKNNELLIRKNHKFHPMGSTPFPKANRTSFHGNKGNHGRGRKKKL